MTLGRSAGRARLEQGWQHGFSPVGGGLATGASAGYRGLLGARDWLYARGLLKSRQLPCPVVSVGNLTVGGTGKTPAVMLAVETLAALGHRPAVVSRGYGRRLGGVHVVADTASIRLDAEDGGDEPFLLARRLPGVPVVVGANRWEAARLAVDRFHASAIVLDDGFQHRTLAKDLEIVMTRARSPWGNGRLLPGGPLREPLRALARADLVVAAGAVTLDDAVEVSRTVAEVAPGVPVLPATYVAAECWEAARMQPLELGRLPGRRVVAFAGIAYPPAFASTLAGLGLHVEDLVAFDDHHWYGTKELDALAERAARVGADALVTTEKDWVRLKRLRPPAPPLWIVSVRLELNAGEAVWRAAFERLCRTR